MRKKTWVIVALVALAIGLGYAGYSLFVLSGADHLTVSELKSQVQSLPDQQVRIGGKVVPGSVTWDSKTRVMKFVLADNRESLSIVYQGIVPDNFKPGAELLVEGRYRPDGILEATSLGSRRSLCSICH